MKNYCWNGNEFPVAFCRILKINDVVLFRIFFLLIAFNLQFFFCFSQCVVTPVFPGCAPSGSVPLIDGAVINSGTTMHFSGSSTYSNVTVNGGTLIVCGNLSLTNFTVNSGVIYVNSGDTLNYNGGGSLVFGSNTSYYNFGTSLFSGHVILNNDVTIINDWYFSSPFNYIIIQGLNSLIVNNYQMACAGFMISPPSSSACLCLGGNSWTITNYFYNKITNGIAVPSGIACLNVRQYVSNDNSVTANPGLDVCVPSGITYNGVPNWGSATVNNNCTGCIVPLPIDLLSFEGHVEDKKAILNWVTMSETNNCRFIVEKSHDGITYNFVGIVNGAINSNAVLNYQLADNNIFPDQVYYYRLKQEDCDGNYSYSAVITISFSSEMDDVVVISPNSGNGYVYLLNTNIISEICVYASSGELIRHLCREDIIDLSDLSSGIFLVKITTTLGKIKTYKIRTI